MRRAILQLILLTALALPSAAAAAPRAYTGPIAGVVLKQNKDIVKSAGVGPRAGGPGFPLQCDEGSTRMENSLMFEDKPKVKQRKFRLTQTVEFVFETIDESGVVVGKDRAPLLVTMKGNFKRSFQKVTGTVSFKGSYFGPTAGPNGSDVQYHNCSGTVSWSAKKLG